ncbi:uncharacterized protein BXZ73DRAFT_98876 [Epithele typhae]|uniref:uncharacterized protein n=1 Tax=Epithele typhae TaxID=378194 RepID=UPI00200742A0|nr:uncharacterized protein BXZ73DRAFT_98876 [Epithele typhae]KAH9940442.1 hypothetical protein BXZ73DRAFT_98876 [Epithele typhae]
MDRSNPEPVFAFIFGSFALVLFMAWFHRSRRALFPATGSPQAPRPEPEAAPSFVRTWGGGQNGDMCREQKPPEFLEEARATQTSSLPFNFGVAVE